MSDAPKTYPRGLPFKPPEELADQEARLKRWTLLLIAFTALVIVVTLGGSYYAIRNVAARQAELLAQIKEAKSAADAKTPDKDLKPPVNWRAGNGKAQIEPDSETQRDRFLDTLGKMTGVHLYQCYLNIGLLADCTESDVYTEEEAQKWLERIMSQMEMIDKQLERLGKLDLDPDEKKGLDRCRQVSALLRAQGKELREYWKNSDKEHANRYHKAREEAWAGVSDVLQLPRDIDDEMPKDEPKAKDDGKAKTKDK